MNDTMSVLKEFFEMPAEDKASLYSEDLEKRCRLYTSGLYYSKEKVHLWRDSLRHSCHPLEECMKFWPEKPTSYRQALHSLIDGVYELVLINYHFSYSFPFRSSIDNSLLNYREVVATYSVEAKKLGLRILELLSEGLGLESGYFGSKLTEAQLLVVNHYPPRPDPSLTLGIPKHCDPNLITILLQGDVHGLQVFKDGEWIGVEPLPNAFVVNIGHQLQV